MARRLLAIAVVGLVLAPGYLDGAEEKQRVLRSNLTPPVAFTNIVKGGRRVCQDGETVPGGDRVIPDVIDV